MAWIPTHVSTVLPLDRPGFIEGGTRSSDGHGTDFGTVLSAVGASDRLVKALEGVASGFVKRMLWVRFPPLAF